MREQGSESHEELLKGTGMFTLGETQMAHDSYSSMKRDESHGDPDCRPLSAGALQQLPHSLYHRSTLSAQLWNTIKHAGEGIPALDKGECELDGPN